MSSQSTVRWGLILSLIGIAVFLFIVDTTGNTPGLISLLRDPLTTINEWLSPTADSFSDALAGPANVQLALEEIEKLQGQVAALERENEILKENEDELILLRNLFDYATDSPENRRLLANVIGRETNPLFRSILINRGTNDGVQVGMPVDSNQGLVGQVFRTTPESAMVILVTDNASGIPGRLGTSRATGLVHGTGSGNTMEMDWIPLEASVEIGDVVLTSGLIGQFAQGILVGRFPKGLALGRVTNVERSDADILQRAIVQSDVNFNDLELVFVITDFPKDDITPFEDPLGIDQ
ncbi:MAG: rod shape-determining protein MreC [Cellvibrionaceae bacterium]|jgi:rod shape-determining protein MreC